jgi:RNA polymerase sigma-70 factor (ECF subfamily)
VRRSFVSDLSVDRVRDDRRDRELLRQLAAGAPSALEALFDGHAGSLFRHAMALTRRREEAEDLVQSVFAKVATTGEPLLGVRRPAGYLHRILRATWIDNWRRRVREGQVLAEAGLVGESTMPADADSLDVMRALDRLPVEQREAVVLHITEGFSFREIGRLTSVSMFTAAARYRLAIRKLRATLGGVREEGDRT